MLIELASGDRLELPDRPGRRMILLRVNTVCNLRCTYCWYVINPQLHVPVQEEIEAATMAQMLDRLAPRPGDVVYLSGGEAVLRRDIKAIARRLHDARATVYLTTNGMMRERLLALAEWIDGYVVSVDSATPDYHDAVRGGHAASLANLSSLRARRPVVVTVVVSRQNVDELPDVARLAIAAPVDALFLQLLWYPTHDERRASSCLGPEDAPRFERALATLARLNGALRLPHPGYLALLAAMVRTGSSNGTVHGCFGLSNYVATDATGKVTGCLPHEVLLGGEAIPTDATSCRWFSEQCACLMGHYATDLIDVPTR